ncbi:hypothetical protein E1A91_A04G092100v1 [Gossypium mustelinum]|uniref:Uncharacterized protein n=1 Tax=Gossypium mustelinum TaxID=34275 RepID=A0A5D2ZLE0_GOSMU|nr:hypothetical protein E1A91_A04G092100v1 [Gossypium mustelinum]
MEQHSLLFVIQKKRSEKPNVRDAAREAALRCGEIKERLKKTKDEKKAKKAEQQSNRRRRERVASLRVPHRKVPSLAAAAESAYLFYYSVFS